MIKHISVIKTLVTCMVLGVLLAFTVSCNQQSGRLANVEIGPGAKDSLPESFTNLITPEMQKWYDDNEENGEIRIDVRNSTANWEDFTPKNAPEDAPNILFILYDDTGLGAWSPYGGKIKMPTLDALAEDGVIYTQWHTTALCSPTRSTIMTGRNHHLNGMASITESADGFPGANGRVPDDCVPFAQVLQDNGYSTFWVGKNHNVPETDVAPGGSRSEWPCQQGFDRFYGFLGGETNNWYPDLVEDNHFIEPPAGSSEGEDPEYPVDEYHLSKDLTNKALEMLRNQQASNPHKPWYMWFNPGANHAPHHSPLSYTNMYKEEKIFVKGYNAYRTEILDAMIGKGILPKGTQETALNFLDNETANPADSVTPWNSLGLREKQLYIRMAQVYAGFSTYTDYHIGRIIDYLKETNQYDNTIILYAADNGASGEGTPTGSVNENKFFNGYPDDLDENLEKIDELGTAETYNHFPTGWAAAFSTPFKMFKRYSQFAGGTNDPLVITWPTKTKDLSQRIRHQYHHSVDIVPTLLEAIGIDMPREYNGVRQKPLSGVSMLYTLEESCKPYDPTEKKVQYYSMLGTRGIWKDGWKALELHAPTSGHGGFSDEGWELYRIEFLYDKQGRKIEEGDRSESVNLAKKYPEILAGLIDSWYHQAAINNVLPLDDRAADELFAIERPNPEPERNFYQYYPKTAPVPEGVAVNVRGRSYTITAHVNLGEFNPTDNMVSARGVLFAHGSRFGGHTMYIQDGMLHYVYNFLGIEKQKVLGSSLLPPGDHILKAEFKINKSYQTKNGEHEGILTLYLDNELIGSETIYTQPGKFTLSGDGLCIGYDSADAVTEYPTEKGEFEGGSIKYVIVRVEGDAVENPELEARRMMLRQ